ncbi:MAG: hypothetical protein WC471_00630 [Candidatus Woesearchaeota archaeon]
MLKNDKRGDAVSPAGTLLIEIIIGLIILALLISWITGLIDTKSIISTISNAFRGQ